MPDGPDVAGSDPLVEARAARDVADAPRKETRQIKEAFIDGFLSAKGTEGNGNRARALAAWKNENTTKYPKMPKNDATLAEAFDFASVGEREAAEQAIGRMTAREREVLRGACEALLSSLRTQSAPAREQSRKDRER